MHRKTKVQNKKVFDGFGWKRRQRSASYVPQSCTWGLYELLKSHLSSTISFRQSHRDIILSKLIPGDCHRHVFYNNISEENHHLFLSLIYFQKGSRTQTSSWKSDLSARSICFSWFWLIYFFFPTNRLISSSWENLRMGVDYAIQKSFVHTCND